MQTMTPLDELDILCNVAFTKKAIGMTSHRCWIVNNYGPIVLFVFFCLSLATKGAPWQVPWLPNSCKGGVFLTGSQLVGRGLI